MRHPLFSLKYRIAASIFALEAVMMLLVLGQTLHFSKENTRLQLEENEQVILDVFADLSQNALFTKDFGDLQQYAEKLTKDPHILKVFVGDRDQRIVVSTDFADVGRAVPADFTDTTERFWRTKAMGNLGMIAMEFSNRELIQATWRVTHLAMMIALSGMVVIAVAGTGFGFLLTRRLKTVSDAAAQLASGNLTVRTNFTGHDEVSIVGQTFDHMAAHIERDIFSLEEKQRDLVQARDELEIRVAERTAELAKANEQLQALSEEDPLTGMPNRRRFDDHLNLELRRALRNKSPLSLIMIDIDYFKFYNDHYGHQQGDQCLVTVGKAIAEAAMRRPGDLAARYGGEEFAVVLPEANEEGALVVANQIREQMLSLVIPHAKSRVADHVTLSIGLSCVEGGSSPTTDKSLIESADQALYQAKRGGRNRICSAPHTPAHDSGANSHEGREQSVDPEGRSETQTALDCVSARKLFP